MNLQDEAWKEVISSNLSKYFRYITRNLDGSFNYFKKKPYLTGIFNDRWQSIGESEQLYHFFSPVCLNLNTLSFLNDDKTINLEDETWKKVINFRKDIEFFHVYADFVARDNYGHFSFFEKEPALVGIYKTLWGGAANDRYGEDGFRYRCFLPECLDLST